MPIRCRGTVLSAAATFTSTNCTADTDLYCHVRCMVAAGQQEAGDVVNLADQQGRTALHKAAYRGSADCIQVLDPNRLKIMVLSR